jgi:hypothetical protein
MAEKISNSTFHLNLLAVGSGRMTDSAAFDDSMADVKAIVLADSVLDLSVSGSDVIVIPDCS